jgi:hypothetical protein
MHVANFCSKHGGRWAAQKETQANYALGGCLTDAANLARPLFPQSLQHLHKGGCNFVRLFAREIRPGWDTCGVEVSKFAAEGVVAALG